LFEDIVESNYTSRDANDNNRPEWDNGTELKGLAYNASDTATGTVIVLDSISGRTKQTPEWNATYTLGATLVRGGNETRTIDTTGEASFPSVTGATLNDSSPFAAGKIYRMEVYTLDGVTVEYSFILLRDA
jgi:hypothetical protein